MPSTLQNTRVNLAKNDEIQSIEGIVRSVSCDRRVMNNKTGYKKLDGTEDQEAEPGQNHRRSCIYPAANGQGTHHLLNGRGDVGQL